jgi:hypothetical protein
MRRLLMLAAIVGGVYLFLHPDKIPFKKQASRAPGDDGAAPGMGCILAVERANDKLGEASRVALRPPVDQSSWGSAQTVVNSEIAVADQSCGSAASQGGGHDVDEAREALNGIRQLLGDLDHIAHGGSGAMDVPPKQDQINRHLEAAHQAVH